MDEKQGNGSGGVRTPVDVPERLHEILNKMAIQMLFFHQEKKAGQLTFELNFTGGTVPKNQFKARTFFTIS